MFSPFARKNSGLLSKTLAPKKDSQLTNNPKKFLDHLSVVIPNDSCTEKRLPPNLPDGAFDDKRVNPKEMKNPCSSLVQLKLTSD